MNWYRFLIPAALIFALGCGGGPSPTTAPQSSSGSEFSKLCRAIGSGEGKLEREKFIAHSQDKEAAAKLFDACDAQQKGFLTQEDVEPAYMDRLKGQVIRVTEPRR
jgi:hypothetical protein